MSDHAALALDVTARQVAMFSMFVGQGLYTTRAALAAASGFPDSTLKNWAGGAAMPLHAALRLRRYLPADAINMMTEPGGARFADVEKEESNWDEICADAASLVSEICTARSDGKIDHVEKERLKQRARGLIAALSEAIEDS